MTKNYLVIIILCITRVSAIKSMHISHPLYDAARRGDIAQLESFAKAGISLDSATAQYGETPLHVAILHGQLASVCYLIKQGVKTIDALTHQQSTPLHYAISTYMNPNPNTLNLNIPLSIISFLLDRGASLDKKPGSFVDGRSTREWMARNPTLLALLASKSINKENLAAFKQDMAIENQESVL